MGAGLASAALAQDTVIRGFTDVSFIASDEAGKNPAFRLGEYDLYIVSDLTDRLTFLSETTFEPHDNFKTDIERVVIRLNYNDHFTFELGKHHTPIGYWNTAYHHGVVLQPTTGRPLMLNFEDHGGLLPIHTIGLLTWGMIGKGFGYETLIGNGIGSGPMSDNDAAKSITVALHKVFSGGLRLGVASYFDTIAAGVNSFQRNDDGRIPLAEAVSQRLFGGNAYYQRGPIELIAELVNVANSTDAVTAHTTAYYVFGGYRLGRFTPYARYDALHFQDDEPYFVPEDVQQVLVGLRFDFSFLAALRLEYQHVWQDTESKNQLVLQFALGF